MALQPISILILDTHAGNAWVGLCVQLGHQVPGTTPHHPVHPHKSDSSRQRRHARRLAARKQVNYEVAEEAISIPEEEVREEVHNEVAEEAIRTSEEEARKQLNNKVAEEAIIFSEKEASESETSDTILETSDAKNDAENVEEINNVAGKNNRVFWVPNFRL